MAVLQRLAQSANPAEPAVGAGGRTRRGGVGSVCAPFYENLKESMTVNACLCFDIGQITSFVFLPPQVTGVYGETNKVSIHAADGFHRACFMFCHTCLLF